ncbi:MAG: flagellar basal body-associated FliL family protein [Gammaproteobacteria bacterium]|nr:flagellar basal body-associated FliL family protein [Gammaproteobacteria bacterium]
MLKQFVILFTLLFSISVMAADEEEAAKTKKPSYVSLGKPMVLNLESKKKRIRFLQVSVDILVEDDDAKEAVTVHVPALRHKVIVLLSEQNVLDMKSPSKRNDIRKLITEQVQGLMDELSGNDDIEDVLFSSFLIQ